MKPGDFTPEGIPVEGPPPLDVTIPEDRLVVPRGEVADTVPTIVAFLIFLAAFHYLTSGNVVPALTTGLASLIAIAFARAAGREWVLDFRAGQVRAEIFCGPWRRSEVVASLTEVVALEVHQELRSSAHASVPSVMAYVPVMVLPDDQRVLFDDRWGADAGAAQRFAEALAQRLGRPQLASASAEAPPSAGPPDAEA